MGKSLNASCLPRRSAVGTVASADTRTLQVPFPAGIRIEEYQLEPVAKALEMPRVNLLIADDVSLGKTIEAGLIIQELVLRHRAQRVAVVCRALLTGKWHSEMPDRFGLAFEVLGTGRLEQLRRGPAQRPGGAAARRSGGSPALLRSLGSWPSTLGLSAAAVTAPWVGRALITEELPEWLADALSWDVRALARHGRGRDRGRPAHSSR